MAALLLQGCPGSQEHQQARAQAQVEDQARERVQAARCIAAQASPAMKAAIARMLVVDTIAPRGALPAWLPATFETSVQGVQGADAWNLLAGRCPPAPAFGTPFGFPTAALEHELRHDPEFAAALDRQWADIGQYRERGTAPPAP